jgi:hypothetical protein
MERLVYHFEVAGDCSRENQRSIRDPKASGKREELMDGMEVNYSDKSLADPIPLRQTGAYPPSRNLLPTKAVTGAGTSVRL